MMVEGGLDEDADGNTVIGRQALRDAIYATMDFDGITGNLNCDENGDCADPKIAINQVQNGEFVRIFGGAEAGGEAAAAPAELPDLGGQTVTIAGEKLLKTFLQGVASMIGSYCDLQDVILFRRLPSCNSTGCPPRGSIYTKSSQCMYLSTSAFSILKKKS